MNEPNFWELLHAINESFKAGDDLRVGPDYIAVGQFYEMYPHEAWAVEREVTA